MGRGIGSLIDERHFHHGARRALRQRRHLQPRFFALPLGEGGMRAVRPDRQSGASLPAIGHLV